MVTGQLLGGLAGPPVHAVFRDMRVRDGAHPGEEILIDIDGKLGCGDKRKRVGQGPEDQGDFNRQANGRSYTNILHHK